MKGVLRLRDRIAVHVTRERRRVIEIDDIYFLEADGPGTLVRTRSRERFRDTRSLGEILDLLGRKAGFLRIHRNHAVNLRRIVELRIRRRGPDWEVKLAPPVNRLLPVGRTALASLRAALGDE